MIQFSSCNSSSEAKKKDLFKYWTSKFNNKADYNS